MPNKTTGIILCGGKNKRMGQNKALLQLGDKTIIEHIVHALNQVCDEIILSTNNNDLNFLPYKKVEDKKENLGPIAGFHSSLTESETEHNLIVSCDTPFISALLLSYLIEKGSNHDLAIPEFDNHLQPMVGYFKKSYLGTIEEQIELGNIKPINIFENSEFKKVEIAKELPFYTNYLFFNINTKEQYQKAKKIFMDKLNT